jgi:hypothetical protein
MMEGVRRINAMTKSQESGETEITTEAKKAAARTGRDVCAILAEMLRQASATGDAARMKKIVRAQKYLGCRNVRRRRK